MRPRILRKIVRRPKPVHQRANAATPSRRKPRPQVMPLTIPKDGTMMWVKPEDAPQANWVLNVPKIAHFYWGAKHTSFLRFMTAYSFRKFNPDWRVIVNMPMMLNGGKLWGDKQRENDDKVPFLDYTNALLNMGVEINRFNFETIGLKNTLNEVHKSDFVRYHLLNKMGGVWADFDILFFTSMCNLAANNEKYADREAFLYYGTQPAEIHGHAIGFLMASQGSKYFADVFGTAKRHYNTKDYQAIGASLLNRHYDISRGMKRFNKVAFLDKDSVYSIDHNHFQDLYTNNGMHRLGPRSVGLHWYGGSIYVDQLLTTLNHTNFMTYASECTIVQLLRKYFPEGIEVTL